MYPPGYQLQSQRVQAAYRYGDISFCHCIIDHTFWKVFFSIQEYLRFALPYTRKTLPL